MPCGKRPSVKIQTRHGAMRLQGYQCCSLSSSLVPVVAIGFDDLRERVEAQSRQAADHQEKTKVKPFPTASLSAHSTRN